jgi:hypothetical protein
MSKYFTVEVKPTIAASKQGAFQDGDALFDWTSFKIPRGAARLVSVTGVFRGENGTPQVKPKVDLYFGKAIDGTAPPTIGTLNAGVTAAPLFTNHVIGMHHIMDTDSGQNAGDFWNINQSGGGAAGNQIPGVVLQGNNTVDGDHAFDTIYVAAAAGNTIDFGTSVLVKGAVTADNSTTISTDDGSAGDPNAELIFAAGDVLHTASDEVIGTVSSIAAFGSGAQVITLTANNVDALSDNDEIFNINPIRLIFSFEK